MPSLLLATLIAYTAAHIRLPSGVAGQRVCIWGYSVYKGEPGFRTLGMDVEEWYKGFGLKPCFYTAQEEALDHLRKLTVCKACGG